MIIILAGKIKSGKDTIANMIKEKMEKDNKKVIVIQFSSYIKEYAKKILNWDGKEETKPRKFLQDLGQDIRENINKLFFINRVIDDIKVYSKYSDMVIISDTRLPDEIDYIKKSSPSSIAIKIVRDDNGLTIPTNEKEHYTEIALNDYKNFDYIVDNNGSLEDLDKCIDNLLENIKRKEQ